MSDVSDDPPEIFAILDILTLLGASQSSALVRGTTLGSLDLDGVRAVSRQIVEDLLGPNADWEDPQVEVAGIRSRLEVGLSARDLTLVESAVNLLRDSRLRRLTDAWLRLLAGYRPSSPRAPSGAVGDLVQAWHTAAYADNPVVDRETWDLETIIEDPDKNMTTAKAIRSIEELAAAAKSTSNLTVAEAHSLHQYIASRAADVGVGPMVAAELTRFLLPGRASA